MEKRGSIVRRHQVHVAFAAAALAFAAMFSMVARGSFDQPPEHDQAQARLDIVLLGCEAVLRDAA